MERLISNPRGTNWDSFQVDMKGRLEQGPPMNIKDKAGFGLTIGFVQKGLISPYKDNCPLKVVRANKRSLKWTSTLQSLRKRGRWPSKNRWTKENLRAGNLIWDHLKYRKEVRKTSKESLRTFCNAINNLAVLARLHGALSRDPKSGWDLWCLLPVCKCNPRRKLHNSRSLLIFLTQ